MLFNSPVFLFLFLPAALFAFHVASRLGRKAEVGTLVGFSLLFYTYWNPNFLLPLSVSILFNYFVSQLLFRDLRNGGRQGWILGAGIAANLAFLAYFKYLFPILDWLTDHHFPIWPHRDSVLLPLGISFFTFTQIGYLVDCRAGIAKNGRFLDYVLFVTFFPHLISGPILHHKEMMPQFLGAEPIRLKQENISVGLTLFVMGLFKKVVFADHLSPRVALVFEHPSELTPWAAVGGACMYSLQLYFDFSGYSEMALGLARLFGISFPANFNSPFKSRNMIEYWQRWHMTLTRYLTLYLYNPVSLWLARREQAAGRPPAKRSATPAGFLILVAFPLFLTMTLAGIWHGSGLQFLCFGLLHAFYLAVNHAWRIWRPAPPKGKASGTPYLSVAWKVLLTTCAIVLSHIFFRSASPSAAVQYLGSICGHGVPAAPVPPDPDVVESLVASWGFDLTPWLALIRFDSPLTVLCGLLWVWFMPNVLEWLIDWNPSLTKIHSAVPVWLRWRPNWVWGVVVAIAAAATLFLLNGTSEYLYFKF